MFTTRVLTFLWLFVRLVHSLSWDIVVGQDKRLEFYYNGTLTHTEVIPSADFISSVTYDPVHYRVLFADCNKPNMSISSFDLSTRNIQPLFLSQINGYCSFLRVVYDPVTQLLFWNNDLRIYSFSLNSTYANKSADGNLIVTLDDFCYDIAVDSCGGYVTNDIIIHTSTKLAKQEGITFFWTGSWVQTQNQNMHIDDLERISAWSDQNCLAYNPTNCNPLSTKYDYVIWYEAAVEAAPCKPKFSSNRYIYWNTNKIVERARFDGSEREVVMNRYDVYDRRSLAIDQQTQKMYWPETIKRGNGDYQLSIKSADFNGKNKTTLHIVVSDKIDTYGYSLAVSKDFIYVKNYNHEGIWQLPKFPSQHKEQKLFLESGSDYTICHRIAAYYTIEEQIQGIENCEALQFLIRNNSKPESTVSICQNYCLQGDCSVSAEGQPTCSCKAGYSGERCEVNVCHKHCLNNGVCSLNEEDEAVCECTADYEGLRCDVATTCTAAHADNTTPQVQLDLYSAVKQVVKEELEHSLQFYSDKIDENKAQIQKCKKSIKDMKKCCSGSLYHDETMPKTQTSN